MFVPELSAIRSIPRMLSTNQTLQNRYRIVAQLGQIDSGLGYEAFDNTLGKTVMLKETLGAHNSPAYVLPATVRHQSLLCVTDSFHEANRRYLVTDHVDGKTLAEILETNKSAFPLKDVALWADGLLDALNHLHSQVPAVIHSNIKPENIKLSAGGNVKLFVFGADGGSDDSDGDGMSFDANVLGYLPIEQIWLGLDVGSRKVIRSGYDERSAEILEQPLDIQSDIYSIGATIYHLVTGRVPSDALTRSIELLEGKEDPLVPASKANPAVSQELSDILMRAMQIKREDRYGSASIMRQVLRSAFSKLRDNETSGPELLEDFGEDDAVLEIPTPAPERPAVRPGMQSGESRQLELIKRQLREAEDRRREAERRAAEAEQRLLERDTVEFKLADLPVEIVGAAPVENARTEVIQPVYQNLEPAMPQVRERSEFEYDDGEVDDAPGKVRSMAKTAGIAAVLLILGAGGFGIWKMAGDNGSGEVKVVTPTATVHSVESKPLEESPVVSTSSNNETPDPAVETVAQTESTQETQSKPRATQTPAQQAKKQPTPTPKSAPQQKKVTLDDLLKDN